MNPGEKWPPEENTPEEDSTTARTGAGAEPDAEPETEGEPHELAPEFIDLVAGSSLVPAICSYLRNDSGEFNVDCFHMKYVGSGCPLFKFLKK